MMIKHFIIVFFLFSASFLIAEDNPHIAVMELEGNGVSKTDIIGLSNRFRTELFKTEHFTVIERGQMNLILKEQAFQLSGCISQECVIQVGQLLSVKYMVVGSVDKVSDLYSVDLRMVNVESGKIEKSVTDECEGCKLSDVLKLTIRNAARKMAGLMPISRSSKSYFNKSTSEVPADDGFGDLFISSTPQGSEIFIDDVLQEGKKTPSSIRNVPIGFYTVKVVNNEWIGTSNVTVKKDDLLKITIPLKRGKGILKIFAEPEGADVFIDGVPSGKTPLILRDFSAGKHEIVCSMKGRLPYTSHVGIGINKTLSHTCKLEKGTNLIVNAKDEKSELNASVYLNTDLIGKTPLNELIPFGKYELKLFMVNYDSISKTIFTEAKENISLNFDMKHSPEYLVKLEKERKKKEGLERKRLAVEKKKKEELLKKKKEQQADMELKRQEEELRKRARIEKEKRKRDKKAKKIKKMILLTTQITTSAAAAVFGGVAYYYRIQTQDKVKEYTEIKNEYDKAVFGFEEYRIRYSAKKNEAENLEKKRNLFIGLALGNAVAFGLTFAF
ncbi:PEGA domain-containing protein [Fibrobacterota bacterium]